MAGLKKVENTTFKEYFEGINGPRRVVCILDDHCVRYMVFENGKQKIRREYGNEPGAKDRCFEYAVKALNKGESDHEAK